MKELNGEIVGNAAKVQTALRLSEEDQTTIVTLKKEVEKAWKLVDASHEKVSPALSMACTLFHIAVTVKTLMHLLYNPACMQKTSVTVLCMYCQ